MPREVAVLVAVAVAVAIGFGVVAPAIPEFARSFGVGKTAAGAVISAFAFMRFVSALGGGKLVDAFGERIILSTGIGIVAVSTGLAGLSQNYEQLLILRGVGGVGSAMFTVAASSLLLRVVDGGSRGRATGLFQSGFLIGGLLGPLAGGFLTDYSLRLPFYVYAVSLIAAGSIGAVFLRSAAHRDSHEQDETSTTSSDGRQQAPTRETATSLSEAFAHRGYRAAVIVNFAIGWALFGVRMSLIPLFVTEAMELRVLWVGVGFLCSSLAQAGSLVFAGRFVDRVGRRPAMVIGCLVVALSLLSLAVTTALPVFLFAMVASGVGGAFIGTAPGAVVGDVMQGRGGKVVAVFQMASDAGAIVGPLVAGWLADSISFNAAFAASAAVLFAATWTSWRMPETLVATSDRYPDSTVEGEVPQR
ncbi:MAG: MFS transporter [Nocardioidaceae bacterium]|nr:MFS transporter [Nocardioidaceae bacterium]